MSGARTSADGARRYEALDSLRGICACFVVLLHARYHFGPDGAILNAAIVRNAGQFVDFFFVLSGFVIAASYGAKLRSGFSLRAYLILRLGRLYPLHLFMILAFAGVETARYLLAWPSLDVRAPFTGTRSLPFLVDNLLLIQIFVPGANFSWNGPSWSIAAEMWTYALTAVGLTLLKARFRFVLIAIVFAAPLAMALLRVENLADSGWPLLRCLFGFSIGMLVFDLHARRQGGLDRTGASLAEAAALAASAGAIVWFGHGPLQFVSPFLFGLAIWVLAREEGAASRMLMLAPMRCLGRWSYSIYMVHALVLILIDNAVRLAGSRLGLQLVTTRVLNGESYSVIDGGLVMTDLFAIVSIVVVIAAAWITYRLVELPFRNASRRLAERVAERPLAAAERVAPTM